MKKNISRKHIINPQALEDAFRRFRKNNDLMILSNKIGMSRNTLTDKLNPDRETHLLCMLQALALTDASGDITLLQGFAEACGMHIYKQPTQEATADNIVSLALKRQELGGEYASLLQRFMEDGKLDIEERRQLSASIDDAMTVLAKTKANLLEGIGS